MITVLFHIYLFLEIMTEMQVKIIIIWRSLLISKSSTYIIIQKGKSFDSYKSILSEWIIIQCCELDFLVLTFVLIKLCDRFINSTRIVCDDTIQANI